MGICIAPTGDFWQVDMEIQQALVLRLENKVEPSQNLMELSLCTRRGKVGSSGWMVEDADGCSV